MNQEKRPANGSNGAAGPPMLRLSRHGASLRVVRSLVPILSGGGVVLLPTDTIYGFSARFDHVSARRRIRDLKGANPAGPMVSLVSGLEMAFRLAEPPRGASLRLLEQHWPGPLTAVLRARGHVPPDLCGPGDTLAFRWPVMPFLQALIGALGTPVVSTSANRTGEPTPSRFATLAVLFGDRLDALIDGGDLSGQASTIVDLTSPEPVSYTHLR
ncbi:MAG: L-threonylcarbamoyladenylate synthase, partial [Candidatus Eisenbacteria bacterium]|nr:L-threonylcarbamoyladenylate synthase [Candidatus Eisenbacteria bacterium]